MIISKKRMYYIIINKIAGIIQDERPLVYFNALKIMRTVAVNYVGAGIRHGMRKLNKGRLGFFFLIWAPVYAYYNDICLFS